jgi:hypothetical protein
MGKYEKEIEALLAEKKAELEELANKSDTEKFGCRRDAIESIKREAFTVMETFAHDKTGVLEFPEAKMIGADGQSVLHNMPFNGGTDEAYFNRKDSSYYMNNIFNGLFKAENVKIVIPEGVEIINDNAFDNRFFVGDANEFNERNFDDDYYDNLDPITYEHYPDERDQLYSPYSALPITEVSLPSTLTSIGNSAFVACNKLKSIDIPDSVQHLGDYVFRRCTALKNVSMSAELFKNIDVKKVFYDTKFDVDKLKDLQQNMSGAGTISINLHEFEKDFKVNKGFGIPEELIPKGTEVCIAEYGEPGNKYESWELDDDSIPNFIPKNVELCLRVTDPDAFLTENGNTIKIPEGIAVFDGSEADTISLSTKDITVEFPSTLKAETFTETKINQYMNTKFYNDLSVFCNTENLTLDFSKLTAVQFKDLIINADEYSINNNISKVVFPEKSGLNEPLLDVLTATIDFTAPFTRNTMPKNAALEFHEDSDLSNVIISFKKLSERYDTGAPALILPDKISGIVVKDIKRWTSLESLDIPESAVADFAKDYIHTQTESIAKASEAAPRLKTDENRAPELCKSTVNSLATKSYPLTSLESSKLNLKLLINEIYSYIGTHTEEMKEIVADCIEDNNLTYRWGLALSEAMDDHLNDIAEKCERGEFDQVDNAEYDIADEDNSTEDEDHDDL